MEFIAATYGCFKPHLPDQAGPATLEFRSAVTDAVAVDRIAYSHPGSADSESPPQLAILTSLRGQFRYRSVAHSEVRIGPRDSFLLPGDRTVASDWTPHDVGMLRIDQAQVQRVAQERIGIGSAPVRFLDSTPIDAGLARFWHSSQLTVTRQFLEDPAMEYPLLHQASIDFICTSLLAAFPNTARQQHDATGAGDARPRSIRRAMAFIDEQAATPITVSDIAAAAGVTPRALQQGFARHVGLRPMEYVRRVRLDRAHLELKAADPGQGATVGAIAARWGFAKPERFAASYREAYGVPPSRTLRADR